MNGVEEFTLAPFFPLFVTKRKEWYILSTELTNQELKTYQTEYQRLLVEKQRTELHIDAILTTAAIQLENSMNKYRLDYAHLSNAYAAFTQNDTESMQFIIVNQTIQDLFFLNSDAFEFITILPYESGAYEYLYRYENHTISIKIPTASKITKDNINALNWGLITVYEVFKRAETVTEKVIVIESDDTDVIKRRLAGYLADLETTPAL